MSEREMNALASLIDAAKSSATALRILRQVTRAKELEASVSEMEAAIKEANGE